MQTDNTVFPLFFLSPPLTVYTQDQNPLLFSINPKSCVEWIRTYSSWRQELFFPHFYQLCDTVGERSHISL